jgi:disulfide oxidoreductase YuzD
MKTKKSKDWFGRSKSVEELHHDSINWLSEIKFINYEMKFLNQLLSSYYIDLLDSGYNDQIKELVDKIAIEKKSGDVLSKLILKHDKILSDLIQTNSVTSNKNYLETHKKFEIEMNIFLGRSKPLKMKIFKLIERVIRKKKQKKFPKAKNILKIDKK